MDYDFSEGYDKIGEGGIVPIGIYNREFPDTVYTANGDVEFAVAIDYYEW